MRAAAHDHSLSPCVTRRRRESKRARGREREEGETGGRQASRGERERERYLGQIMEAERQVTAAGERESKSTGGGGERNNAAASACLRLSAAEHVCVRLQTHAGNEMHEKSTQRSAPTSAGCHCSLSVFLSCVHSLSAHSLLIPAELLDAPGKQPGILPRDPPFTRLPARAAQPPVSAMSLASLAAAAVGAHATRIPVSLTHSLALCERQDGSPSLESACA